MEQKLQSIAATGGGEPVAFEICPKCGGNSWYEVSEDTCIQRCLCGLHKVVAEKKDGMYIIHTQKESEVTAPKPGTKLSLVLASVFMSYPEKVQTAAVAERTGFPSSEAASLLMVLGHKGLIERVDIARGKAGGSTWKATARAEHLFRLKERMR